MRLALDALTPSPSATAERLRGSPVHNRTSTRICVTETVASTLSSERTMAAATARLANINGVMSTLERGWRRVRWSHGRL